MLHESVSVVGYSSDKATKEHDWSRRSGWLLIMELLHTQQWLAEWGDSSPRRTCGKPPRRHPDGPHPGSLWAEVVAGRKAFG